MAESKPKLRVVVELSGGVVQGVHTDSGQELDVVFLEEAKYVGDSGDREYAVKEGPFKDLVIYTHYGSSGAKTEALDPVFKAAQERLDEEDADSGT